MSILLRTFKGSVVGAQFSKTLPGAKFTFNSLIFVKSVSSFKGDKIKKAINTFDKYLVKQTFQFSCNYILINY